MSGGPLLVAFPARGARDWEGRRPWGRDAHLIEALARVLGPAAPPPVVVLRTGRHVRRVPAMVQLGSVGARAVAHPVEIPAWTRSSLSAALARRWAARPPRIPDAAEGFVLCCDLLRHGAAQRLADQRGWPLVTDLMDDWRRHESMPAWHRHIEREVYPSLPQPGHVLTAVTSCAAASRPAVIVPNAGHHDGDPEHVPHPGPPHPVAAFVGTIHSRLDADAMLALVRDLPGWDVVAVGPVMDAAVAARLDGGGVRLEPWWDLSGIDRLATVMVAPYTGTRLATSGDPLKVYEATARGVPCVTTVSTGRPPVVGLTVATADEFAAAIAAACDLDRAEVVRAARATGSWEDRAREILAALRGAIGTPAARAVA